MKKEAILLYGAAADRSGTRLGWELDLRVRRVAEELDRRPEADMIIARTASGFVPVERYSELIAAALRRYGVSNDRIKICEGSGSTVGETASLEAYLRMHPEYERVWTATSRYHIFRVRFIQWWFHRRVTLPMVLPMSFTPHIAARTALESLKFLAIFVPTRFQDLGNDLLKKFGLN